MFRRLLLPSILALPLLAFALPAVARENFALLIGAGEYRNLPEKWWLNGPRNDVALVAGWLMNEAPVPFSPERVRLLTDGPGQSPATLGNIRAAFADLTQQVGPGDFVYLHFSGHGSQAPARDPDSEPDGLDELFLPVDIGPWNDGIGEVENALVDDEIGLLIDALRLKGADVWVVFDSCHSGTATRTIDGAADEVRMRQLDPAVLGLDLDGIRTASRAVADTPDALPFDTGRLEAAPEGGVPAGSLTAFYAAQTTEVTPEKNLPKGRPDRRPQGVFTFTLFETLAEYPAATYGQVAQEVLRKYATGNRARATPLFEGDLDRVVFGGVRGERIQQWPLELTDGRMSIPAGSLHGLSEGVELAVLASPADPLDKAIGHVSVTGVDIFRAEVEPADGDSTPLPSELRGLYLRRTGADLDFGLTVALPPAGLTVADALLADLDHLRQEAGPRITFVPAGSEADLALAVLPDSLRPDAVWLLPGDGEIGALTDRPAIEGGTEPLAGALIRMARALNLMKLGAAMGPGAMDVDVALQTRGPDDSGLRDLPAMPVPVLRTDDEVHVLAQNNMPGPVDVNVLYIGADYSISHWYSGRLHPGDQLKQGLFAIGGDSMGQERMIVVVTPANPQTKVEDLSWLAQDALVSTRALGTGSDFGSLLGEAAFGETTRGAVGLSRPDAAAPAPMILQLELRTRAAD